MAGHLLAFLAVSAIVIVTPGPDTALTLRNTLVGGRRAGTATAGGVATGQASWTLCTAAGVAALLRAWQPAFVVLRIAGAAYLVFLGLQGLAGALRARPLNDVRLGGRTGRSGVARAYRQGLLSNLANPKMAVFFLSLLPQFAGGNPSFASLLGLGLLFSAMTLAWLTAYAALVAAVGGFLQRARIRRVLEGLTGAVLVGLGLRLASESP